MTRKNYTRDCDEGLAVDDLGTHVTQWGLVDKAIQLIQWIVDQLPNAQLRQGTELVP